jgi:hypothetical protein
MSTESRDYEYGRIVSVDIRTLGDNLVADTASGATSLVVEDAYDFDETGGQLVIGGVVITYTAVDDETGTITLLDPTGADAFEGDAVNVYDATYMTVSTEKVAQVEVTGDDGNVDTLECQIALHLVDKIAEGVRGGRGESVKLELDGPDWVVIDIYGLGNPDTGPGGPKWEADDVHTLAEADISAGSAIVELSQRPIPESLTLVLGIPQPPAEWTIDYDAQTVTCPLGGWEAAGDSIWVHYAYRLGLGPSTETVELVAYQASGWKYFEISEADTTNRSAPSFDDSSWATHAGAFASGYKTPEYPNAGFPVQATTMTSEDIGLWLRRSVTCPTNTINVTVSCRADGNVWVYWDGALLGNSGDTTTDWPAHAVYTISGETNAGSHTLAVRFLDDVADPTIDSSYVDVRVVAEVSL